MKYRVLSICAIGALAACQAEPKPAVLEDMSPETMAVVTGVLAGAVGRARIEIGPGDLTADPAISVLPPPAGPLEGNNPALPSLFDIVLMDGDCYVMAREGGEMYLLADVQCRSISAD